ncbi:MAG: S-methyl-5-thioribose-1-phosphate isomerase [Candidatus Cyclonatronum sp.]|uniref:S-methyl-5-thioribose-1-phosphate isomerase n=1 Tax=Cyclonatronum sp. TaxID=3024185 RepID=UPI0025BEB2BD|nr:S-methyl-5-thioribose-1-phosphate isomerase [Cyclonatronum sp.]MCC5933619.1 S-methyl-5-thioribose-1-phosphate isomerase [Balneolales bacterium]MCH8485937.1 S-methyl-5-thioribose-1-phosphate isomerase [Cyclonatronum sp.]
MTETRQAVKSIEWREDHVRIIDQTFLPSRTVYCDIRDIGQMWDAIKKLKVRGAPAIGIAAAYAFYLGIRDVRDISYPGFRIEADRIAEYLASSRPTAVNLKWALDRILVTIHALKDKPIEEIKAKVLEVAKTIHQEDIRTCKQIGLNGQELVPKKANILTHCNTGGLATGQYGTALSMIFHAHFAGKKINVWVDETRPLLQGARLTAWELNEAEVPFKLVIDSASGHLMKSGLVDLVVVGTDRVAANGDTANKIGTYNLSVLAKAHGIPFYVALPLSTIDLNLEHGDLIPIEERDGDEITHFGSTRMAPKKIQTFNPAFDVTPAENITAFITEKGIIRPPFKENLRKLFE